MEHLTGKEISYLYVCRRKLWLFHHGIRPEMENDNVRIGMLIGEQAFSRQKKEIPVGDVGVLDWADFPDGIIHETKKDCFLPADQAQVRYYMFLLDQNGVAVREAQIHYPEKRKVVTVKWNEQCRKNVLADVNSASELLRTAVPPCAERRPICKKCAYEEVCFA